MKKDRLEIVGILAGVAYALISFFQWQDLRHNFIADERAWINMKFVIPKELRPDLLVPIDIVNVGKNPALRITAEFIFKIVDLNSTPEFDAPKYHTQYGVIPPFPAETYYVLVGPTPNNPDGTFRTLTADEVNRLVSGGAIAMVYGEVRYEDPFGPHWARFCHWHNYAPATPLTNTVISSQRACLQYNSVGDGPPPSDVKRRRYD